jgi:hypothetical protein
MGIVQSRLVGLAGALSKRGNVNFAVVGRNINLTELLLARVERRLRSASTGTAQKFAIPRYSSQPSLDCAAVFTLNAKWLPFYSRWQGDCARDRRRISPCHQPGIGQVGAFR